MKKYKNSKEIREKTMEILERIGNGDDLLKNMFTVYKRNMEEYEKSNDNEMYLITYGRLLGMIQMLGFQNLVNMDESIILHQYLEC